MTERNFLTKTLTDTVLSRRSFLKWSAALGGTAAMAGGLNLGLKTVEKAAAESEGIWISLPCWHLGCGGYCVNFGLLKDGIVVKQKADDTRPDSPDNPLRKGCLRGRAQRTHVFGADRLKYPMKRKHWEPGGGDKELRGRDEWVRISWEEALDLVASELKRIKVTYGNQAILNGSGLMSAYGGYRERWGNNSEGNMPLAREKMAGTDNMTHAFMGGGIIGPPDRFSYRDSKLIVLWGENPAWSAQGTPMYNYQQAHKAGAKFIFVTPELNPSAVALDAEWIPVRPSTDAALLLGMAYYMIVNNLQDQEFLDKYTIGFDAEHMPAGANPKDNFKDYVLGTYDGVPKTPEWASEICGTDSEMIRQFALEIATTKPMIFQSSLAPSRTHRSEQFAMAHFTVGWMTGNVGLPGAAVCASSFKSFGGMHLIFGGGTGEPSLPNPLFKGGGLWGGYAFGNPFDTEFVGVAYEEVWDAILNNEVTAGVRGKIPCDIRLWYGITAGGNHINQTSGTVKAVKAFRKLDFIVECDIVLSNKSKYADIVLPGTTPWEEFGFVKQLADKDSFLISPQVISPLFEAKDVPWIETELAKRLDLDPNAIHPFSPQQRFFNKIAGTIVFTGAGMEPLVTITEDDIKEWGVDGNSQQGRISIQDLLDQGGYTVQRSPGDIYSIIANLPPQMYRADPVANPAKTESGKLEIYCKELARYLTAFGFDTSLPLAGYRPPVEGIEDTYKDWGNKIKGDYPLQLFTPHYIRRAHSSFNNVPYLRRAFPQEFMMNVIDAKERGIKTGDTVLVTSRHGKVLRRADVSEFIIPGAVLLGEGSWFEFDEETGIDKGGCTNTLSGARPCGQGMEPFNSCNVQVEKWTGEPLEPDYKWPQRIPLKEA